MHTRLRVASCLVLFALAALSLPALADDPKGDASKNAPAPSGDEASSEAPKTLEELLARWQEKPGSIGRGLKLQDAYVRDGRQRDAEALFRKKSAELPDDQAVRFLYGRVKGGKYGLKLMREALAADLGRKPGDSSGLLHAWIAMAVVEVEAGNASEAEEAARRIATMRGKAEDWTYLGWIQENLGGSADRARVAYTRAIRSKEDHLPARNALAMLHAEAGTMQEAVALVRGSVAKHPQNAEAHLHLGLVLAMSGDAKGAVDAYGKALSCAGDDADALAAIAAGYMDIEEQDLAYKALQKALALDPNHGSALINAGALAMDMGDVSGGVKFLDRAAKLLPKDAYVAYLQGVGAQRLDKDSRAISHFRKAMELDPDSVEYVTALALANVRKGSLPSAVTMFKRAIKMAPDDPELYLQLGITYLKQRKHKVARDAFGDMIARAPEDPRPHYYLAIIYGDRMGKSKEALAALEEYARLGGTEPTALSWLADLRAQLGK